LIDWLDYNGYSVVTKATKEFVDQTGRRKVKGNMEQPRPRPRAGWCKAPRGDDMAVDRRVPVMRRTATSSQGPALMLRAHRFLVNRCG
jgi:hypothetical protein